MQTVESLCTKHTTKPGNFSIHQNKIYTCFLLFSPVALVSILNVSSIEHFPPIHLQEKEQLLCKKREACILALQSSNHKCPYPKR